MPHCIGMSNELIVKPGLLQDGDVNVSTLIMLGKTGKWMPSRQRVHRQTLSMRIVCQRRGVRDCHYGTLKGHQAAILEVVERACNGLP